MARIGRGEKNVKKAKSKLNKNLVLDAPEWVGGEVGRRVFGDYWIFGCVVGAGVALFKKNVPLFNRGKFIFFKQREIICASLS